MEKRVFVFVLISLVFMLTLSMISSVPSNLSSTPNINKTKISSNVSVNMSEKIAEMKARMIQSKNSINQTYGQCVEEQAKAKTACILNKNTFFNTCMNSANSSAVFIKNRTTECNSLHKTSLADCKTSFKNAKSECKKIKHSWMDTLRYSFK